MNSRMTSLLFLIGVGVASCSCVFGTVSIRADEVDELREALREIEDSQSVSFPQIRIGAIERWAVVHEQGVGLGQVLKFEHGESREPLVKCLQYREQYMNLVLQKKRLCDALNGQIKTLQGAINQQAAHRQQAELAGIGFNPALMQDIISQQAGVQASLRQAIGEHSAMVEEFNKLEPPIAAQFSRLVKHYLLAASCVQIATPKSLPEICTLLRIRATVADGYAENVLLTGALIRNGEDMEAEQCKQVVDALEKSSGIVQSSRELGLSPINIDRMTLSILCNSREKLSEEVSFIKKDRDSRSNPRALYMLGTYHGAKNQIQDAKRYLRSARAKIKDDLQGRARAVVAADVVFYELCGDQSKDLDDVADLAEDVELLKGEASLDWQIFRGQAVIESLRGDYGSAKKLVTDSQVFAPPLVRAVLADMAEAYEREERYVIEAAKK